MAATPITISITFVEVAVVTGSFLFIGQAPNASAAQQVTIQLNSTASAANAALTTAVASVFRTWLALATSSYVGELTATLGVTAATIAASNTLQLGLFSSVQMQDVTVTDAVIDPNVTAALNVNRSADAPQNYAYNVTLRVVVLTADMLVSVFVDVLNSTSGPARRLLVSKPGHSAGDLWATSELKRSAEASTQDKAPDASHASVQKLPPSLTADAQVLLQQLGFTKLWHHPPADAATMHLGTEPETDSNHAQQAQHAPSLLMQSDAATVAPRYEPDTASRNSQPQRPAPSMLLQSDMHGSHTPSQHEAQAAHYLLLRHLLQSAAGTAPFPLTSLLFFKRTLVLDAFFSTSGCSNESIADLFYQGSAVPPTLGALCWGGGSAADRSLDAALLGISNSSVPLLQVVAACSCRALPVFHLSLLLE